MVIHPYTLTAKQSFCPECPNKSVPVRIYFHIWNVTTKNKPQNPLHPPPSVLTTSPQSQNPNAWLHRGSQPSSLWEWLRNWSSFEKSAHFFPQGYFFKLTYQRGSLQQHWQGQRQMSEKGILVISSALTLPLVEPWSETCLHHKKITVGTQWLWSALTPSAIPPRNSLPPSKSQPKKSFTET